MPDDATHTLTDRPMPPLALVAGLPANPAPSAEDAQREYKGRPIRPLDAWRAYRKLMKDKEDTVQVFEIMNALSGMSTPNGYVRLTRVAGGIAFKREELSDKFRDPDWLARFAPGTVGAAYRGVHGAREPVGGRPGAATTRRSRRSSRLPHVYAWYGRPGSRHPRRSGTC